MDGYKILRNKSYSYGEYSIVPIRWIDRFHIMKWRNEQMYHLRQNKSLTAENQEDYFRNVIVPSFRETYPSQILFSYIRGEECIGYGGLVHINWIDKHAEISFLMDTDLEAEFFDFHWSTYLKLIEKLAFQELKFHKIFTYAYDLRPKLYVTLEKAGYEQDARLKEHCYFQGEFIDVIIHSKIAPLITLRVVTIPDMDLIFKWANDKFVRKFSNERNKIEYDAHKKWFLKNVNNDRCAYFIMEVNRVPAGSIRFDLNEDYTVGKINYLLDKKFSGKGLGTTLLEMGVEGLKKKKPTVGKVWGQVFKANIPSVKVFRKLDFEISYETETEFNFEKEL